MIAFRCGNCQTLLNTSDASVGKGFHCPMCGRPCVISRSEQSLSSPFSWDEQFEPAPHRSRGSSALPCLLLGMAILVGSIGGGIWCLQRQNDPGHDNANTTRPIGTAPNPKQDESNTKSGSAKEVEPLRQLEFYVSAGTVTGIALSRDGNSFITTSSAKSGPDRQSTVVLTMTATQKHINLHRLVSEGVAAALSLDEKMAVFCDGFQIVFYDLRKKAAAKVYESPRNGGGINCLAASANGCRALTGSTVGCISCWDLNGDGPRVLFEDNSTSVVSIAVSADGSIVAAGLANGSICVCDVKTGVLVKRFLNAHSGEVTALAFSPDGGRLVSGGEDARSHVWEIPSGKQLASHTGHNGPILGCAWSSNGQRIITAGVDQKVRLWIAATGKLSWEAETRKKVFSMAVDSKDRFVLAGLSDGVVQLLPLNGK
jgi:WD40 repeat protein